MKVQPIQYVTPRFDWNITLSSEEAKDLVWLAKVLIERDNVSQADSKLATIAANLLDSFKGLDPSRALEAEQEETLVVRED